MGLKTRLIIWVVAMLLSSTVISVVMTTVGSGQRLDIDLQRRANLLSRSLEISAELSQALQDKDRATSNQLLQLILSTDTDAKFLFLLTPTNDIVGWAAPNQNRALELGVATPNERESIVRKYFDLSEESRPLFERLSELQITSRPQAKPEPAPKITDPSPQELGLNEIIPAVTST